MVEGRSITRVFVTVDPLALGRIVELDAIIDGDTVQYDNGEYGGFIVGEGRAWHRQRWAAENYARQLQLDRLRYLRGEVDRIERMQFGRRR